MSGCTTSASATPCSSPFPDNGTTRNILIDVGNVLSGKGGDDSVFKPVVEAIKAELGGKPLDLYVMTHEHMDHIQGLPYAKEKAQIELDVDFAWITASAAPEYYDTHPDAKKKKLEAVAAYEQIAAYLEAASRQEARGADAEQQPPLDRGLRLVSPRARRQDDVRVPGSARSTAPTRSRRRSSRSGDRRRTPRPTTARCSPSRLA